MRRHLGDQPDGLQAPGLAREDVLGVEVEGRERADRADEHAHRVGVVLEPLHQLGDVRVQHGVLHDVLGPLLMLRLGRQLAEEDEIGGFEEVAVLGQLLDRVAAVEQDALVAVDIRDPAAARGRVHERRVVRHHPELVRDDLDLAQVHGPNRAVLDGDLVLLAGAVVGNRQRVGHAGFRSAHVLSCRDRAHHRRPTDLGSALPPSSGLSSGTR